MKNWNPSVRLAIRTFLQAFLALFIPGLFGWLNALTEWAKTEGQTPFPDAMSLAYLGVVAIVAGFVSVSTLLWNLFEGSTGKSLLHNPRT